MPTISVLSIFDFPLLSKPPRTITTVTRASQSLPGVSLALGGEDATNQHHSLRLNDSAPFVVSLFLSCNRRSVVFANPLFSRHSSYKSPHPRRYPRYV